jgi:hypothetical protein
MGTDVLELALSPFQQNYNYLAVRGPRNISTLAHESTRLVFPAILLAIGCLGIM